MVILECNQPQKVLRFIYFFLILTGIGFLELTWDLLRSNGISTLFFMLLRNRHKDFISTGNGHVIFSVFGQVSLILLGLIMKRDTKHVIVLAINLIILFLYSSFLSSRILFFEGIIFFFLIIIRRYYYFNQINTKRLFIITITTITMLIITSGYRDFDEMGENYTNSKFSWGTSRIQDYITSTMNISLEIVDYMETNSYGFPSSILEISRRFKRNGQFAISPLYRLRININPEEYTNVGSIAQIYSDVKYFIIPFVFFLSVIYGCLWLKYDSGDLLGLMFYPIVYYNIFETWRIYYFGTELAEVLVLVIFFVYILINKSFTCTLVSSFPKTDFNSQ